MVPCGRGSYILPAKINGNAPGKTVSTVEAIRTALDNGIKSVIFTPSQFLWFEESINNPTKVWHNITLVTFGGTFEFELVAQPL